ncbi:heterokaryon incompatibility protein-domain-containing protein [Xylaria cf. heliscus]|nr:heterokaryon incompatibility protein-domain-containing protein [Xylaria cf. heliscus]
MPITSAWVLWLTPFATYILGLLFYHMSFLCCVTDMGNYNSSHLKEVRDKDISDLVRADHDDIPEVILCKLCTSIFSESSYEQWSKWWQKWEQMPERKRNYGWSLDPFPFPRQLHQSLKSFEDSVKEGCYLCFRFNKQEKYWDELSFPLKFRLRVPSKHEEQVMRTYELSFSDAHDITKGTFYIRPASSLSVVQQLSYQSKCRAWTGHHDIARIAKHWVGECLTSHDGCLKPSSSGWKPLRLLDVSKDKIKLVSGASEEVRQHYYVTLSHCWGTRPFDVLTFENKQRYYEGVDMSEFEPTFRETITTVRQLGFRYLWIDCYCIIQGTDEKALVDWKSESLRMGQVYANSILNIGALESTGPADGLFRARPPGAINGKITWSPTEQDGPTAFYPMQRDMPAVFDPTRETQIPDMDTLRHSPLMSRGWVIQECAMAARMLSFGRSEIFWQCSELFGNENAMISARSSISLTKAFPFCMLENAGTVHRPGTERIKSQSMLNRIKFQWIGILNAYCNARLTYPQKDLFVALDGIGAEVSKLSGGLYKYGMLDLTLPGALLYTYKREIRPFRQEENKPTWHWSSCYPRSNFSDLNRLYYGLAQYNNALFPLAYAFMSGSCTPLPDESSKDFWPNMLLIGRLMKERPVGIHEDMYITLHDIVEYYLPLIATGKSFGGNFGVGFHGLTLVQSDSGAYRRVGIWRASGDDDRNFGSKILETRPRLIVLE